MIGPDDEDEYSHPPAGPVDLAPLGVQVTAPSKRRVPTTRVYAAPLSDEAIARIRRKAKERTHR